MAERFKDYAHKVKEEYEKKGIRAEVDSRAESVSKKIREAQLQKINYMLVVGEKEVADNTVTVRTRENKIIGVKKTGEFLKELES